MNKIISSNRIYFKKIEISDIDKGWLKWVNQLQLNKYLEHQEVVTRQDLIDYVYKSNSNDSCMFAICLVKDDSYIGNARLSDINIKNKSASYGRLIGEKSARGCGIGTEALMLLSYYAFYRLKLNRLETGVIEENTASIRSNQKAGAIFEGVSREASCINNKFYNVVKFGILRSDFSKSDWQSIIKD